ncbi:MAG: hypothetical protein JNM38_24740 [Acidobacteria bacterium]|nr:hypothetical protein [Acidobacteriota bacterium]
MTRLTVHLAWHDLRAVRWLALVWTAAMAVGAALVMQGPSLDYRLPRHDISMLTLRVAGTALLVALIVQRDSLVTPTAFWRTRPLPRTALLASKLASCTLVVAMVPALSIASASLLAGASMMTAAGIGIAVLWEQLLFGATAFALASVTHNLTQLVAAVVGAMLGVMLVVGVAVPLLLYRLPSPPSSWAGPTHAQFILAVSASALGIAAFQFYRLRTVVADVALGLAVVVTFATLSMVPLRIEVEGPKGDAGLGQVSHSLGRGHEFSNGSSRLAGLQPSRVQLDSTPFVARVVSTGAPATVLLRPRRVQSTFTTPLIREPIESTQDYRSFAPRTNDTADANDPPYRHLAAAAAVDRIVMPDAPRALHFDVTFLNVPTWYLQHHRSSPGRLVSQITFDAFDYRVTGVLPVETGTRVAGPVETLRIESVGTERGRLVVGIRRVGLFSRDGGNRPARHYLVRHRETREALVGRLGGTRGYFAAALAPTPASSTFERLEFVVPAPWTTRDDPAWRTWMRSAELLVIDAVRIGTHSGTVIVDDFSPAAFGRLTVSPAATSTYAPPGPAGTASTRR